MGSLYDSFNFGGGVENVYTDIPGTGGGADTVTDTLVTPFGNINLDSLFGSFDAAAPMQPGDAFTGLEAGDSSIGADAFTIGGTTFDPITTAGTEGYDATYQILGVPPLMEIGGGTPDTRRQRVGPSIRRNSTSTTAPGQAPPRSEASSATRM